MRIALLCPGPSLSAFPGLAGFDLLIGVNRAVVRHECDWWSVGDAECATEVACKGPRLWTHDETARRLTRAGWTGPIETYRRHEPSRWPLFSATAALVLARRLGATSVDCWGVDMTGDADWDGGTSSRNRRSADRWALERAIWAETCADIGIEVIRHGLS